MFPSQGNTSVEYKGQRQTSGLIPRDRLLDSLAMKREKWYGGPNFSTSLRDLRIDKDVLGSGVMLPSGEAEVEVLIAGWGALPN